VIATATKPLGGKCYGHIRRWAFDDVQDRCSQQGLAMPALLSDGQHAASIMLSRYLVHSDTTARPIRSRARYGE
jgi:hypothetical protein